MGARTTTGNEDELVPGGELPAVRSTGPDSMRDWALELVSRVRSEGVDLTGDQGS